MEIAQRRMSAAQARLDAERNAAGLAGGFNITRHRASVAVELEYEAAVLELTNAQQEARWPLIGGRFVLGLAAGWSIGLMLCAWLIGYAP